ncbi:phosphatase domain-containing putative toxin [Paludisphaera soli]|uniref:phosphatase domain-containing putative toxin n=1 Tax=Paludisphaera soli TaxID=2712865 RepID=UPI001F0D5337|nr:tyrosine-protein phosphatase [Paludisphaera soli]
MSAGHLARTLRDRGIRTVLNLRGPNPAKAWYRDERSATLAAGATQVDVSLSSCVWMSRVQLRTLVKALDEMSYPVVIHCAWGSERTGLVSAFAELLREGSTLGDAREQLALKYLYVPFGDGRIMSEALDQYEAWLAAEGLQHRPETFRRWADSGYKPGNPSREAWPYDPYPLIVVSPPGGESKAAAVPGSESGAIRR